MTGQDVDLRRRWNGRGTTEAHRETRKEQRDIERTVSHTETEGSRLRTYERPHTAIEWYKYELSQQLTYETSRAQMGIHTDIKVTHLIKQLHHITQG